MDLLEKFITNDRGKVVLWQKPNFLLSLWLITAIIDHFLSTGSIKSVFEVLSFAAFGAWIILEVTDGSSPFRRALGIVILGWLIIRRI